MGNKLTGEKNVLILGLQGAGKTHMLYTRLVGESGMHTIKKLQPTAGYNYEEVETVSCNLNVWDVGAFPELVPSWNQLYLKNIPIVGLIYLVNLNTAHTLILESVHTFINLVRNENLDSQKPISLVFN